MSIVMKNIDTLAAVPPGPLAGPAMRDIPLIHDATLEIRYGKIGWFGPAADAPSRLEDEQTLDLRGATVIPGLIDAHTHVPFVGNRADEFARRIAGESYLSIMQAGGGIRVTTQAVREASEDQLVESNFHVLARMATRGVTTIECKSGYGLAPEHELKQLRAIAEMNKELPIELVPTYLGAHAVPAEYEGRPDEYIDRISAPELLRQIADEGLARFCDVFCDAGAFTVEQARRVLTRAAEVGLRPKLHADELEQIGASRLAGELHAVSADHLEKIDDAGIAALRDAGTIGVLLPGTSFFLGIEHCDARRLIDAGLPVALATDYNPGSCMIESLPLVMNIACCQMHMLPTEVLAATTANAAAAIGEQHRIGAIQRGYDADVVVLAAPTLNEWFYTPGRQLVAAIAKRGELIWIPPSATEQAPPET